MVSDSEAQSLSGSLSSSMAEDLSLGCGVKSDVSLEGLGCVSPSWDVSLEVLESQSLTRSLLSLLSTDRLMSCGIAVSSGSSEVELCCFWRLLRCIVSCLVV